MDLKSIARSLAASSREIRAEGFTKISSYIQTHLLTAEEILRVWKSLYYCKIYSDLWMADKDHELISESLVSLDSLTKKYSSEWTSGFFQTMRNEWNIIDPIRIDKFMYLVRVFLRNCLKSAISKPKPWIKILDSVLNDCLNKAMGLLFHIVDIYLEELPETSFEKKLELIGPFISLMKSSKLIQVTETVNQKILLKLAENKEKALTDWVFSQATTHEAMGSKAREKFYDLYALITGQTIPNRELDSQEAVKKKKKKQQIPQKAETIESAVEIPEALSKVLAEFYEKDQEKPHKPKIIGKDVIELKHEIEADVEGVLRKKKKKRKSKQEKQFELLAKDFSAKTGEPVEGQAEGEKHAKVQKSKSKKKVNFNLTMNTTRVFDKKNILGPAVTDFEASPKSGILKRRPVPKVQTIKKQKVVS